MLRHRAPRPLRSLLPSTLAILAACSGDSTGPRTGQPLPPLLPARWHAHTADGQPLPAVVAHRLEDGALVQHVLDSAQLDVRTDGTWERRLWLSRFRSGALEARVAEVQPGTWVATDTAYVFTAMNGRHRFSAAALTPGDSARVTLRGASEGTFDGAIVTTLRVLPPEAPIVGSYRATSVMEQSLPARVAAFDDEVVDGRRVSIHLIVDSARVQLLASGRYEHVVHWSEWEGPVGGEATVRRVQLRHADFGTWSRDATRLQFESGWLQNHRFAGTTYDAWRMELLHGVTHGEMAVPYRYARE